MKKKDDIILSEIGLTAESTVSSINFARLIQDAILCNRAGIKKSFGDYCIVYEPKNILSGDFYFYYTKANKKYLAVCDCTGHGVSGALLSILGNNMLERAFKKFNDLGEILTYLNQCIKESFDVESSLTDLGMDMVILSVNQKTYEVEYSGARRPFWVLSDTNIEIYKTDKMSIGTEKNYKWHTYKTQLKKSDRIFMFSDGITDQFGGEKGSKLGTRNLKTLIKQSVNYSLPGFSTFLNDELKKYRGDELKTDDSLLIGIEL